MEEKTVAPVTEASAAATAPRKPMRKPARRKGQNFTPSYDRRLRKASKNVVFRNKESAYRRFIAVQRRIRIKKNIISSGSANYRRAALLCGVFSFFLLVNAVC